MIAIALDRASVRSFDKAGHLHVEITNISKANICPYLGSEIPDGAALGLDPNRVYRLLRDPVELAKAAPTFTGKPLLLVHRPQTASDHSREITIGAVGEAVFDAPYLRAPLSVWDGEAIDLIERGEQQELSCGYFYRADMTPGTYEGEAYDGRMVEIAGNHVALVSQGRAGPDVVVGDSITEMINMLKSRKALVASGALMAFLSPRLAKDAALPDINALLKDVTAATWQAQKPKIRMALDAALTGKLAKDASLDEVVNMLDKLDDITDETAADEDPDEPEEQKAERMAKAKAAGDEDGPEMKPDVKAAMDAAIAASVTKAVAATEAAVIARMNGLREAERVVRPYVGEIAVAMDSAEAVYRFALGKVGVEHKDLHPSALKPVLLAQPVPGSVKPKSPVAMDAAAAKSFAERFPGADRIRHA